MSQIERIGLLAFGTAVPPFRAQQAAVGEWMADSLAATPALRRWMRRLYDLSGIETRYSCLADYCAPPQHARLAPGLPTNAMPGTAERMEIYRHEATALGAHAAQRALDDFSGARDDITHLIVVSCTGFFAPGLDQAIANRLGLRPTVERTLVGFMGCAAAFNALRLARQIVAAQSGAQVLVVCVELCSLHMQSGDNRINLVVTSLFSDGAAACVVGAAPNDGHDCMLIDDFYSELVADTAQEMVWQIGDHGFTLHLSPDIPRLLGTVAPRAIAALLHGRPMPRLWAIHPGGRAIVDRLVELFALAPEQVAPSFDILRRYGNMSSPTILFVLQETRARLRLAGGDEAVDGVAMAFGPGLVVEMAHLSYVPAAAQLDFAEAQHASSYVA